jgi:hypothetical protein
VQLFVNSGQCTGGYILADATHTYIAMAARHPTVRAAVSIHSVLTVRHRRQPIVTRSG